MSWNGIWNWNWFGLDFGMGDAVQIFILYLVIYSLLKAARGSRFGQVLTGVGVLFAAAAAFTFVFQFAVLAVIIKWLLVYLVISSVVIFQPEIRRILATMGAMVFQDRQRSNAAEGAATPELMTDLVMHLAARRMGALLAIERGISLRGYEQPPAVRLDALVSQALLVSIFTEPMPLHDGGAVVRDGRLSAAHCTFPLSARNDLTGSGMRHRAAMGLSEETDALVIVVSEETGRVSLAQNGHFMRGTGDEAADRKTLLRHLAKALRQRKTPLERLAEGLQRRLPSLSPHFATKGKDRAR